jgi:hypothetical protein
MKPMQKLLIPLALLLAASLACQLVDQVNFNISEQIVKGSGNVVSERARWWIHQGQTCIGDTEISFGDQAI